MNILKLKWHIAALFRTVFYKIIYGSSLSLGKGTTFRRGFNVCKDKNAEVIIGSGCFFNNYCSINSLERIEIGENCIFGEGVKLYDHNHRFSDTDKLIKDQGYSQSPVKIGKNCWLGSNVIVLKGCTIGVNCVIGAGCIVSQSIPDNMLVSSNRD